VDKLAIADVTELVLAYGTSEVVIDCDTSALVEKFDTADVIELEMLTEVG
jgi:hypothetical protein